MACFIRLSGGFGNQLFKYALGRHLELSRGCEAIYEVSSYHNQPAGKAAHNRLSFDEIGMQLPTTIFSDGYYNLLRKTKFLPLGVQRKLVGAAILKPRGIESTAIPADVDGIYFWGWWHDRQYFEGSADTICRELRAAVSVLEPPPVPGGAAQVVFHVRRGDLLTHKGAGILNHVAVLERARQIFRERLNGAPFNFLVFSDDLAWCKEHLAAPDVSFSPCRTMMDDFRMMLGCSHYVISNSTFSWWAAYLNPGPGKIVCAPMYWRAGQTTRESGLLGEGWLEIEDR